MLSGRPVLDNAPDAELFIPPGDVLERCAAAVSNGFNVLLTGPPGAGRTSALHALARRLRTTDRAELRRHVIYTRVEGAASAAAIADMVLTAHGQRPDESTDVHARLAALGALARNAPHPLLVMVDDVPAVAGHQLFGLLRDELWQLPLQWAIAARESELGALSTPPADAFIEATIALPALTSEQASELLARRNITGFNRWLPDVLAAGAPTPRAVLNAARAAQSGTDITGAWTARAATLTALPRPQAAMAAALQRLGAAAASDIELLRELNITRARAVQILQQLQAAGLVRAESVRTGRGHPRKVYTLTDPA